MPVQKLIQKILTIIPPQKWEGHAMLLGVSGGADSVAMLRLIHQFAQEISHHRIYVCHANHQLRGEESDGDEHFVRVLCKQLNLPLEVKKLPIENSGSDGLEAQLRNLRYQMFKELAGQLGARYVMTAHNADDQAETILFRILRGTGIAGLAGIPPNRPLSEGVSMIRPLLNIRREEITHYLTSIGQPYRDDSSNQTTLFTRNKIRNQLIPMLQKDFECNVIDRLTPLAHQARQQQQLLDELAGPIMLTAVRFSADSFIVDRQMTVCQPTIVVRHLLVLAWKKMKWPLQAMTFEKWNELATRLQQVNKKGQPSRFMLPGKIEFSENENSVSFVKR